MPRGGVGEEQIVDLERLLATFSWKDSDDCISWELEPNGTFTVASARSFLDNVSLWNFMYATRWNSLVS